MYKQYEDIVKDVCNINKWNKPFAVPPESSQDHQDQALAEKEGAVAVACVLAYIKGISPELNTLSKEIGVDSEEINEPLKRLIVNGMFASTYDPSQDEVLLGEATELKVNGYRFSGAERTRNAWAKIAGIGGGLTGLREKAEQDV